VRGSVGNFRLERELSRDTTAISYLATHRVLPRTALVKVMADVDAASEAFVALQMFREAGLQSALQHGGVPVVFEAGLHERRPWFAAEHIAGVLLADALSVIDRQQAVALVRELADILDHAHQRGVVHCGLQPDHVTLANRTYITDWSPARAHDAAALPYTPTLASWHYTAPELQHGHPATDRADTYSLGVIAHQMLAGIPYARGGQLALDGVPHDVTLLVAQMLAEDPRDRPSCAEVLGRAFAPALRIRRPRWTPDVYTHLRVDVIPRDAAIDDDDDQP
jgi:serine/threonine protein kinase